MEKEESSATIVLSRRRGGYRDIARSYLVIIDGKELAKIKRGQTIELPVAAGLHEVFLKIDWCRSPTVHIDAAAGEVIKLFCEPGGPPYNALRTALGNTGAYISLTRT